MRMGFRDVHEQVNEGQESNQYVPYDEHDEVRDARSAYIDNAGNFCETDDNGKTYLINGEFVKKNGIIVDFDISK